MLNSIFIKVLVFVWFLIQANHCLAQEVNIQKAPASPSSEIYQLFKDQQGYIVIMIGGITSLAPSKRSLVIELSLRALLAAALACFCTAALAGLFY